MGVLLPKKNYIAGFVVHEKNKIYIAGFYRKKTKIRTSMPAHSFALSGFLDRNASNFLEDQHFCTKQIPGDEERESDQWKKGEKKGKEGHGR